ncbi:MAG: DUF2384 domain-containing protein [Deltaproteobacteria bacterium]|nr:DUF2384 domain-containing protein [Deltaproteobacteria bacterium]
MASLSSRKAAPQKTAAATIRALARFGKLAGSGGLFARSERGEITVAADEAIRVIKLGIAASAVAELGQMVAIDKQTVSRAIGIDKATLQRREKSNKRLDEPQSEAAIRAMELVALAVEAFGTMEMAGQWLEKPHPLLDDHAPLTFASNQFGAEKVASMLMSIRYGGVV